jgi:hypothetical protein
MRPFFIIESDSKAHCIYYLMDRCKYLAHQQLILYCVVYSLSLRVILRIATLCHADSDAVLLQQLNVKRTGILYSSVGVV